MQLGTKKGLRSSIKVPSVFRPRLGQVTEHLKGWGGSAIVSHLGVAEATEIAPTADKTRPLSRLVSWTGR
jgi:hypothetical protein